MPVLETQLDTRSETYRAKHEAMLEKLATLDTLHAEAAEGGGPEAVARLTNRNKMPVRERIAWALDPDSPFLELSPLAA